MKLGPTVAVTVLLLYKYVFHTYIGTFAVCGWYVCNAGCFVVRYQCCLNPIWEGFGIMLMTLTGWFDLVLGSDVTM